jgi:hypothetical protein
MRGCDDATVDAIHAYFARGCSQVHAELGVWGGPITGVLLVGRRSARFPDDGLNEHQRCP